MSNANIVSSLVVRAAETHGGPAWVADATRLLSQGGDKVVLVKSEVEELEESDDADDMGCYALFTCKAHVLWSGATSGGADESILKTGAFLKKHGLDIEFGVYKGKLGILLSNDCERYAIEEM